MTFLNLSRRARNPKAEKIYVNHRESKYTNQKQTKLTLKICCMSQETALK